MITLLTVAALAVGSLAAWVGKIFAKAGIQIAYTRIGITVTLVLPLVYVIYTALREGGEAYVASVTDSYAVKAIWLTVKVVLITVLINSIFGLFAAWLITRFQFRGKKVISTLIDLPLTISPIIA